MSIVLMRVDNRLIHGQVIASWVPQLNIEAVIDADEEMATDDFGAELARLAVPEEIELEIIPPRRLSEILGLQQYINKRVLVLFRDLTDLLRAIEAGVKPEAVNLGNIHFQQGKRQISPAIALDEEEEKMIRELENRNILVEIRAVPNDRSRRAIELL